MSDEIKCVIWTRGRKNDSVFVKGKQVAEGAFERKGHRYLIDTDRYQLTTHYRWGFFKREYPTLYYRQGGVKPVKPFIESNEEDDSHVMTSREFSAAFDEDLLSFLRGGGPDKREQQLFFMQLLTTIGVLYLAVVELGLF